MNRKTFILLTALFFLAACGRDDSPPAADAAPVAGQAGLTPAATTGPQDSAPGPAADQYGLERFMMITETYRAPVKVGLRTRRESSSTVTRYVDRYGERVAMETRSGSQHEQYYWDGQRGILRDVTRETTADQRGVRLRASEPDLRAVASQAQLESWGYEPNGEKTVLGRTCEIWKSLEQRTEFCRWQRLVLESRDFDADGNETGRMTAVEIREGEGIPREFELLQDGL